MVSSPDSPDSSGIDSSATGRHRRPRVRSWRTGVIGVGAVLALGVGVVGVPAQQSLADSFNPGQLDDLLTNDLILDYLEVCRSADGTVPEPEAVEEAVAVADCSQSTGNGTAVVLPENIELGNAAENITIDLGDDINVLGLKYQLGERNLIEILSAAALGNDTVKKIVGAIPIGDGKHLPKIDPGKLGAYSSYEQVQADAALPVKTVTEKYCDGVEIFGRCIGTWRERTSDANLAKRQDALKIAEHLTGHTYDATKPVELPDLSASGPRGSATVAGDGMQVAAAMRGGTAVAEAKKLFGLPALALAGADQVRSSVAFSQLGISTALNMDTDEIGLTWFGQAINFDKLKEAGITDLAGDEAAELLDTAEHLEIPQLKEVSCFGLTSRATAEGLGSCSNILGTFDTYEDLRDPVVGESRQTQVGITDLTSLVLGNDALVKQLTGKSESTPFLDDLMANLTSEDGRLKFAKDFVRLTRDVRTEEVDVLVLDDEGNPVLNEDGTPKTEKSTRETSAVWLTSDYGLRDPVTVEWLGHRVVFFPAVEVNGTERPNILSLPQIEKIADDADTGLLPKVSLVTWDNAFGLGTVTFDDLSRPDRIFTNWVNSVTLPGDLKWIGEMLGLGGSGDDATSASAGPSATESATESSEASDEPSGDVSDQDLDPGDASRPTSGSDGAGAGTPATTEPAEATEATGPTEPADAEAPADTVDTVNPAEPTASTEAPAESPADAGAAAEPAA